MQPRFKYLDIPETAERSLLSVLEDQVAPILVNGYRPGEGVDPLRFPTETALGAYEELWTTLRHTPPKETPYTGFARGSTPYADYISALRDQLSNQGGGWVTVAPRDTAQQGFDSESASINVASRRNAEVWAEQGGCVGYETGGAQLS